MPTKAEALDRYTREVDRLVRNAGRLEEASTARVKEMLGRARQQVTLAIADAPSDWTMSYLRQLQERIRRTMIVLESELGIEMIDRAEGAWDKARDDLSAVLDRFETGPKSALARLPLDTDTLRSIATVSVRDILRVSRDTENQIDGILQRSIIGQESPFDAIQKIGQSLVTDGEPTTWSKALSRAETIYRTETGTHYSAGQQMAGERWNKSRPGLLKIWDAANLNTRPSHEAAENRYSVGGSTGPIPWEDDFTVGDSSAPYPRHPSLPPKERMRCRCTHAPYRAEWVDLDLTVPA